jgi:hypothetical protein
MRSPGEPQAEPTMGKPINGGFHLLEARCSPCERVSLVALRALQPPETRSGSWKLEAALYCEPCSEGRHYSRRQRAQVLGLTYARSDPEPGKAAQRKTGAVNARYSVATLQRPEQRRPGAGNSSAGERSPWLHTLVGFPRWRRVLRRSKPASPRRLYSPKCTPHGIDATELVNDGTSAGGKEAIIGFLAGTRTPKNLRSNESAGRS